MRRPAAGRPGKRSTAGRAVLRWAAGADRRRLRDIERTRYRVAAGLAAIQRGRATAVAMALRLFRKGLQQIGNDVAVSAHLHGVLKASSSSLHTATVSCRPEQRKMLSLARIRPKQI